MSPTFHVEQFTRRTLATLTPVWCSVLVIASVGCQTYSPYGYNGGYSGSYPMYSSQPGQVMPYGSTGMQPGTTVMPVPNGGYPGAYSGGYPAANYPSGNLGPGAVNPYPSGGYPGLPQGADTSGDGLGQPGQFPGAGTPPRPNLPSDRPNLPPDDADYFNPGSSGTTTPPSAKRPAPTTVHPGGPADFQGDRGGPESATQKLKKMETSQPAVPDAALYQNDANGLELGSTPIGSIASTGQSGIVQTSQLVETTQRTETLRPYGRAPNGRAWFRGLVDYDEEEKVWYLIYNPEPEAADKQGGTITLVEHPHLSLFKPDDVILVEGQFDPSETDHFGNAKYRAEVIRRLIP